MKGRGTKKLKHVNLKIAEVTSKNVAITAKKRKTICPYTNHGHLSTQVTSEIDLQMNQLFNVMFQRKKILL